MSDYCRRQKILNDLSYSSFVPDIIKKSQENDKNIGNIRIKVIGFRDFDTFGEEALWITRFFNLNNDNSIEKNEYINTICEWHSESDPNSSNSLEALAIAINSEWTSSCNLSRQIVILFTDDLTHPLKGKKYNFISKTTSIPECLEELCDLWVNPKIHNSKLRQSSKRLIIFAPDDYPWSELYNECDQVIWEPIRLFGGLYYDVGYDSIIEYIVFAI